MTRSDVATLTPPSGDAAAVAAAAGGDDARPGLAVVCNGLTPYRLHLHRRIVRGIPEFKLWTVFTHQEGASRWSQAAPAEIGPVHFHAPGESSAGQGRARGAWREWRKGGRIVRWFARANVRAVVLLGYNDLGRLRIARWCRRRGVPCMVWGDSNVLGDEVKVRSPLKAAAKRLVLGRVLPWFSAYLPCGTCGKAFFGKYGADPARMFLMPLEADYDAVEALAPEFVGHVHRRFGLAPGRRRLVFSGRLVPLKRVDLVLDAFAAIAGRRPDWDLLVVGDGPERAALEARVPAGLRGRVVWAGFVEDAPTVAALYRAADVLVLASEQDAWGLVVNEAMAAGLAVVSSDVAGAAIDLVRDGINGFTFRRGDGAGLTARLLEATDPERVDALRAASPDVLRDWRRRADPVQGLRDALKFCGAL